MSKMGDQLGVRAFVPDDLETVLALNEAAVPAVSPHGAASFRGLLGAADHCWTALLDEALVGFLLTFAPGADYLSPNYQWLSERFERFRYVDRIVIAPVAARRGLGRRLYAELEASARNAGAERLLCEVNVEPHNPRSLAFHEAAGWEPIEDRVLGPGKVVRYFGKRLT